MLNKGHSDSHYAINNVTKNTPCCMTDKHHLQNHKHLICNKEDFYFGFNVLRLMWCRGQRFNVSRATPDHASRTTLYGAVLPRAV